MKLSLDQRKVLSEFLANLGVAWFAGGIVAPILTLKNISDIYFPGIWGLTLTIISVSFSLLILRKK
jgi:hypothetical protein